MNDWTRHLLEEWQRRARQRALGKPPPEPPESWTGTADDYQAFAAHTFVADVVGQDDPPELSERTVGLVALALTAIGRPHRTWSRWAAEAIARDLACHAGPEPAP